MGFLELKNINEIIGKKSENKLVKYWNITFGIKKKEGDKVEEKNSAKRIDKKKPFLLKEAQDNISFSLSKCCNPIPGEQVIGYLSTDDHVNIHRADCKELAKYLSNQGERIVAAEWTKFKKQSYLSRLQLQGFDRLGVVNQVTNVISKEHNINMRSLHFDTHEGIFKGDLFLYIHNTEDLNNLVERLKKIKGIDSVSRVENLND